ncbi:ferritin-3, chloroplastic-like [Chenopodium quinoa]|uniref:Ferritin n=1 Tax=Chenopodium quinoa TaxID=63459 RepID=A0A803M3Z4_CHEQI|nr:ferritin-3, chloroplastic-like [Chenopodium quinoa]
MLLRASPAFSLLANNGGETNSLSSANSVSNSLSFSSVRFSSPAKNPNNGGFSVSAAAPETNSRPLTGVIFEPFEEVKKELSMVPTVPQASLARQKYADDCESAINEQINVEYNVSYVYHAMYAYFDRDNVALKGLAKFFKESSEEEREHAEKLMEYQNKRGGKVKLQSILMPLSEFDHEEKGDALHAMELALSLEKLVNEKLLNLHQVAEKNNDVQLQEYIEGEFLNEQVEAIKKISEYVAQLRRIGKGHGVWHFDQTLLHEGDAAAA